MQPVQTMAAACLFPKERKKRNPIPDRRYPQQPTGYDAVLVPPPGLLLPSPPKKVKTKEKGKSSATCWEPTPQSPPLKLNSL